MWAQQWGNIYDVVAPASARSSYDLTATLQRNNFDAVKMVKTGENFYTSLGLPPLPETFWQRSLLTRPRDREVVCHASAWDIDDKDDIRIKMCTRVNADDFDTVHHELGHNYYQRAYAGQDFIFRDGANDGFHEAIGDFAALNAMTPTYLNQIGLLDRVPGTEEDIPFLLKMALDKIAFLPFGLLIDKWRWDVFSGATPPEHYNDAWWELRTRYQGIAPPGPRPADAFDPGAKYHIPGNTPYARYFLAFIYEFQFYRAACREAGWQGPLQPLLGLRQQGGRREAQRAAGRWARRAPGPRRSPPSPARATSMRARSATTSRRSTPGSPSRTAAGPAAGSQCVPSTCATNAGVGFFAIASIASTRAFCGVRLSAETYGLSVLMRPSPPRFDMMTMTP